jgi:hypothetical protein
MPNRAAATRSRQNRGAMYRNGDRAAVLRLRGPAACGTGTTPDPVESAKIAGLLRQRRDDARHSPHRTAKPFPIRGRTAARSPIAELQRIKALAIPPSGRRSGSARAPRTISRRPGAARRRSSIVSSPLARGARRSEYGRPSRSRARCRTSAPGPAPISGAAICRAKGARGRRLLERRSSGRTKVRAAEYSFDLTTMRGHTPRSRARRCASVFRGKSGIEHPSVLRRPARAHRQDAATSGLRAVP